MDFDYASIEEVELQGAMLVTGMPAVGMEGSVAANFLVDRLEMRIIGSFQSDEFPPVGAVRAGIATSPIQVWGAELACGPDGRCDRLLVLKSDVPVPTKFLTPLASAVTDWAHGHGVALLIGLDSYSVPADGGAGKEVLVAMSLAAKDLRDKVKGKLLADAMITGFTAAMLVRANREKIPAIGLFAPSTVPEAEAPGTTALLDVARPLIPKLNVDTAELAKLVEQKSLSMRDERQKQAEDSRRMHDLANRGYL